LFDDLIDWAARKQAIISTSIIEAKLLAMLHADKEFIWWIHLFEKLRFNLDQKMIIYNDNLQIIRLLTSEIAKVNIKLRHVDIAQCWLRQSVGSYWLAKEWIATAVYLKWMGNSAHYIENLFHSSIYWSSSPDSSRFIWGSRSSFVTKIFSSDQGIFVSRCHSDLISSEPHIHLRTHWSFGNFENQ
jgi:hypothetical protein